MGSKEKVNDNVIVFFVSSSSYEKGVSFYGWNLEKI